MCSQLAGAGQGAGHSAYGRPGRRVCENGFRLLAEAHHHCAGDGWSHLSRLYQHSVNGHSIIQACPGFVSSRYTSLGQTANQNSYGARLELRLRFLGQLPPRLRERGRVLRTRWALRFPEAAGGGRGTGWVGRQADTDRHYGPRGLSVAVGGGRFGQSFVFHPEYFGSRPPDPGFGWGLFCFHRAATQAMLR